MDKNCKTCKHHNLGKCLVMEEIITIEILSPKEKVEYGVESGTVQSGLEDILANYIDPIKHANVYEDLQDLIYDLPFPTENLNPDVELVDISTFYCSKYE